MYSPEQIDSLKSQTDLVALFASYGYTAVTKGKDRMVKCPFHHDDNASLSISKDKGLWHCFGCGAKGNAIQLVEKLENIPFLKACEKLMGSTVVASQPAQVLPLSSPLSPENEAKPHRPTLLKQVFERFLQYYRDMPEGKRYLAESRHLDHQHTYDLVGYCPVDFASKLDATEKKQLHSLGILNTHHKPFFAECVVFALRDIHGVIQSLYGRSTNDKGAHYYLPGPRNGLFGSFKGHHPLIIVESCLDALTLIQKGFSDVMALHGVNGFEGVHEQWLKHHHIKDIVLLLDGDSAGREAAARLRQKLSSLKLRPRILDLPDNEDPNSYLTTPERVQWLRQQIEEPQNTHTMASHWEVDTLIIEGMIFTYSVQGLSSQGLEKLRVTLRVHPKQNKALTPYIDTIDLYSSRHRERLGEGLSEEFDTDIDQVMIEIKSLIPLLEKERLKLKEEASKAHYVMNDAEKSEALQALKSPSLLHDLLKDFESLMIGEEKAKLLCYLGTISRLMDRPLGVLIVSRSGAGKTTLQDAVGLMVPEESLKHYTRLTSQALFYSNENGLKHKVLSLEEEDGMKDAMYSIRTLQSSQKLTLVSTRSDPKTGKLKAEEYTVEGPVFIIISTTNPDALDFETRNRFIVLTINESEEQTRRIMEALKESYTLEGKLKNKDLQKLIKRCQNMQRLLKPIEVVNPFARALEYPFDQLQMRREFHKYMTLINSIALFHQYQREVKYYHKEGHDVPYIEVELSDVALANELVFEFFPHSIDEMAPHTRRFTFEINKLIQHKGGELVFTRKELRDLSGWSDWSVRKALEQLESLGYVRRVNGQNGVTLQYELLIDATMEKPKSILLTDIVELEKLMRGHQDENKDVA